jgi:hypothetical protein
MKKPSKGLINEVLPDPEQAARDLSSGSPRDRTTAHLRRIVAAAAAAALPLSGALADNSVPGGKKDDKKGTAESRPASPPPEVSYGVVDPMPPPYINKNPGEGTLRIESTPSGCRVSIDGVDTGLLTPIKKYTAAAGMHAISVTTPDGKITKNATIELKAKETVRNVFMMRPPKPNK